MRYQLMNSKKTPNIMDVIDTMISQSKIATPSIWSTTSLLTPVHGWYRMEKDGSFHQIQNFEEANKDSDRVIAKTKVGKQEVSTVFLGLDHNFGEGGGPVLFESMIFPECLIQQRYRTHREAVEGHEALVAELEAKLKKKPKPIKNTRQTIHFR